MFQKTILLLLYLLLFTSPIYHSQVTEYKFKWSDFDIELRNDPFLVVYSKDKEGNYILLKKEPIKGKGAWQYYLETRNEKFEKTGLVDITDQIVDELYEVFEIIVINKNIVFFSKLIDKNKTKYYKHIVDIDTLIVSERALLYEVYHTDYYTNFVPTLEVSLNKKKVLLTISSVHGFKFYKPYSYILLDDELNVIWNKKRRELGENITIESNTFGINNDLYIITKKDERYFLNIFNETTHNSYDLELDLDLTVEEIKKLQVSISLENKILISGVYTNEKTYGYTGVCLWEFDKITQQLSKVCLAQYNTELMHFSESPKSIKRNLRTEKRLKVTIAVSDLIISDIKFDENKNIYFLCSQSRLEISDGQRKTYHSGDIYITKINNDFKLEYNVKVPYKYRSANPEKMYSCFFDSNKLSVVYMDNKANLDDQNVENNGTLQRGHGETSYLGISTIEDNGIVNKSILYNYTDFGFEKFKIWKTIFQNNEIMILSSIGGEKFRIGILDIKESK